MRTARSLAAGMAALFLAGIAHIGSAEAATSAEDRVRAEAEAMAEAASGEFNAFMERQRVAQADTAKAPAMAARPADGSTGVLGWFRQSGRDFQSLMRKLAGERAPAPHWDPVAEAASKSPTQVEPAAKVGQAKKPDVPGAPAASAAPAPAAAAKPPAAAAKPPAEERKLAETRRAEFEKRTADAAKAKPGTKTEAPKPSGAAKAPDAPRPASTDTKRDVPAKSPVAEVPAASPAAKKPASTATADAPKAVAPAAKAEPAGKQPAPARQPSTDAKVAANAPPPPAAGKSAEAPASPARIQPAGSADKRRAAPRALAAACRDAGRRVSPGHWYTARAGDSLWRIAERHLGSGSRYPLIRAANRRTIADAGLIRPCQRIYIPRGSIRGER